MNIRSLCAIILMLALVSPALPARAALIDQVNTAFQQVFGRLPVYEEWKYWAERVQNGDKTTYDALVGAMGYYKAHGNGTVPSTTTVAPNVAGTTRFATARTLYPSQLNPNFLPNGTLVKSAASPNVYYLKNGTKSWILPEILNRWFGEAHFFKSDVIITIPAADLARYKEVPGVNPLYSGKVLKHPTGAQFYIDDKLRKRPLSAAIRTALKFPGKNLYATTDAHLKQFKTGPALSSTTIQPGGMILYDGPFHGGRIWRLEEASDGAITKRLYLGDYFYEAEYYPDESQRVAVSATELARYRRGTNIDKYPDGWVVGIGTKIYVVQGGTLRLIGSSQIFSAMGYNPKYILKVFPLFLARYPHGQPIGAFKGIVSSNIAVVATPQTAPNSAINLTKVRPAIRAIIATINDTALPIYDREITAAENKFWVDYVYNGEVNAQDQLVAAMKRAVATGTLPARTSRTAVLSSDTLKLKWFPYLFYFVHQKDPNEDEKDYWYRRIVPGDRDTIEKLGGTLQWLKDTSGLTHK